ncbi:MAG: hypothetical protein U9R05_11240 [Chloroflexota bacterium]|nr:hypothetical protein [Chloroflexota bacterium]
MPETTGLIIGSVVTLLIFSYLIGDNLLYRWALALLVGAGTGYALAVGLRFIIFDWLNNIQASDSLSLRLYYLAPLLLGALLLLKGIPRLSALGNVSMGFMLGVGAAVAISGALLGTLIPQMQTTATGISLKDGGAALLNGGLVLVGTLTSLFVFSPRLRRADKELPPITLWLQRTGRAFVVVFLAVAFSGALTSALTILIERLWELADFTQLLFRFLSSVTGS